MYAVEGAYRRREYEREQASENDRQQDRPREEQSIENGENEQSGQQEKRRLSLGNFPELLEKVSICGWVWFAHACPECGRVQRFETSKSRNRSPVAGTFMGFRCLTNGHDTLPFPGLPYA